MTKKKKAIKKLKIVSKMLICLPFVRCVILNGSLASGNFKESSDIDLLIVAKSGRIFTARFFTVGLVKILGLKRQRNSSKKYAGKFCLNYFLTEDYLEIPQDRGEQIDKYCAKNYSSSKFMAGDRHLFNKFILANKKLFCRYSYWNNCSMAAECKKNKKGIKNYFQILGEQAISGNLGNQLEQILKKIQLKTIKSDYRTRLHPDLIVCNDSELRFHPPKEKK